MARKKHKRKGGKRYPADLSQKRGEIIKDLQTVCGYFRHWMERGIWKRVHDAWRDRVRRVQVIWLPFLNGFPVFSK